MGIKPIVKYEMQNETIAQLTIYGVIGSWSDGNEAKQIQRWLRNVDAEEIHVNIHSPGGDAFDGIAIHNLLKNHKARVIVHVDGYACSAASVIAMAGDEVIMPSNTMLMIHQASTFTWGNADDLEKIATDLRGIDGALSATYKQRFIGTDEELAIMLKYETWLTAEKAVALGFADKVSNEIEIPIINEEPTIEPIEQDEPTSEDIVAKYAAQYKPNVTNHVENKEVQEEEPPVVNTKSRGNAILHL